MNGLDDRCVEPEILDGLAADDPRAAASRQDLYRINVLMFQSMIMASLLGRFVPKPPRRILEIGAGDGKFMLAVARRMAKQWPGVELVMLDRVDLITAPLAAEFQKLGWTIVGVTADVFDWTERAEESRFDAVTVNLFLHHLTNAELIRLFSRIMRKAPLLLATEPLRAQAPLFAARLLPVIGVNDVTRNDAPQSVRAGFRGKELSELWLAANGTPLEERRAGLFSHVFVGASTGAGMR